MKLTRRGLLRLGLLTFVGLAGGRGFFNSRRIEAEEVAVKLERLPPAFDGFKMAQITDIHAGPLVSTEMIRAGVEAVMSRRPDLVVLTGDFVSGATRILWTTYGGFKNHHLTSCLKELSRLAAPLGVYGVLGNHDFWSGAEATRKLELGLRGLGVRLLRNQTVSLKRDGETLLLAGVDDYWEGSYNLDKVLREVPASACVVLLSHNPDVNEDLDSLGRTVDLMVSGHTHGGQVVLPWLGAPYLPSPFGQKYRAGLVRDGARQTYVSRGLGVFFVPVRLNCPPEVTIITLRKS
ncbi:MAG: metallophosphoesterase [Thermodesulfobacteriota bacterium]